MPAPGATPKHPPPMRAAGYDWPGKAHAARWTPATRTRLGARWLPSSARTATRTGQDRAKSPGGAPRTTATGGRLDHDHEPDAEEAGGSVLPITIIVVIIETYLDATNVSVMIQP